MKNVTRVALLLLILLVSLAVCASATGSSRETLTVDSNNIPRIGEAFDEMPLTLEAWISLPIGYSERGGTIVGNYKNGSTPCINFEIHKNGKPRLYFINSNKTADGTNEKVDIQFNTDVRLGELCHVAITLDETAGKAYCYLNGTLQETRDVTYKTDAAMLGNCFAFMSDLRSDGSAYFKGELASLALYTTTRSAQDIRASYESGRVALASDTLIACDASSREGEFLTDLSGNGYTVRIAERWITSKEPVTDYAYSMVIVGDTQELVYKNPDKLSCIYDWIVENKEEKRIELVLGLGDITDKSGAGEWQVAKEQIFKLNGVVPYTLVRGNHDKTADFNSYFAGTDYTANIKGYYESGKIDNVWTEITAGGVDYLNVVIDHGANDRILEWASGIIEAHPYHRVIITTHCYLYRDGTTLDKDDDAAPDPTDSTDKNNGDDIWEKLVSKHENIFMVISGHDPCDNVIVSQRVGDNGNVVTEMLVDPQNLDDKDPMGLVCIMYFAEDGTTVDIEYYSTVKEQYFMSTSQMSITVPEYTPAPADPPAEEGGDGTDDPSGDQPDTPDSGDDPTDSPNAGGADTDTPTDTPDEGGTDTDEPSDDCGCETDDDKLPLLITAAVATALVVIILTVIAVRHKRK